MVSFYSKAYLSTQVNTAGRLDLIIALYEKAITHVNKAMKAINAGDEKGRSQAVQAAADILTGLCESLDFTEPGGMAGRLLALYHYQLRMLLEAHRTCDVEPLQSVKTTLNILLNGWRQVGASDEAAEIRRLDARNGRAHVAAPGSGGARSSFGMMA